MSQPQSISQHADEWIKFFEWCELQGITLTDAYESVKAFRHFYGDRVHSLPEATDPGQAELPLMTQEGASHGQV
jgi:hypothetical protein